MKSFLAASGFAIVTLIGAAALADSWERPQTTTYLSSDKTFRLTVVPRSVNAQAQGISGMTAVCAGALEKREGDGYRQVWHKPLVNEEAPVNALVAGRTGYVITFDNWASMGYGDDVIVIYSPTGELVRKLALKDFLSAEEIEGLPRSVSSILWHRKSHLTWQEDHVEVEVDAKTSWWKLWRIVKIRLADGAVVSD